MCNDANDDADTHFSQIGLVPLVLAFVGGPPKIGTTEENGGGEIYRRISSLTPEQQHEEKKGGKKERKGRKGEEEVSKCVSLSPPDNLPYPKNAGNIRNMRTRPPSDPDLLSLGIL